MPSQESDPTKTSRKPEDTAFKQQRLPAWQPILTPAVVIISFTVIGLIFLPLGIILKVQSDSIIEHVAQYDGSGTPTAQADCKITSAEANTQCTITFDINQEMKAPVYVYYQLDNFYQNHRRYVKSRSAQQLMGDLLPASSLANCDPLITYDDGGVKKILDPCGLIANSFFDDWYTMLTSGYTLDDDGIAWQSDVDHRFAQPNGFQSAISTGAGCVSQLGADAVAATYTPAPGAAAEDWCVKYPEPDKYFYLYQRYPNFPNLAVEGVTNEHFVVWMRTAALPTFRKLFAKINQNIPKGTRLQIRIDNNFEVVSFGGKKSLVLSTVSWFGGKNNFLGVSYIVVGAMCLVLAVAFAIKQATCPRKLGDSTYLGWKID